MQSMSICLFILQCYRSDRKDLASYDKYLSTSNEVVDVWKKNIMLTSVDQKFKKIIIPAVYGNMYNVLSIIQNENE